MSNLSPEAKKAIKDMVVEVSGSKTRAEGERDFQSEAIKKVAEDYELDKGLLKKICSTYHRQRFQTEKEGNEAFEITYAEVFELNQDGDDDGED